MVQDAARASGRSVSQEIELRLERSFDWQGMASIMSLVPSVSDLGDFAITTAGTQTGGWVTGLAGMTSVTLSVNFEYGGSGGTSVKAYIQTSFDQGVSAVDVACVAFTTVAGVRILNLSGLTPRTTELTPTDGALADDTAIDGILGDRFRVKLVTTGLYSGSTVLAVRANVR